MSEKILISGATGNIGRYVVKYLSKVIPHHQIIVANRSVDELKAVFSSLPNLECRAFDFENPVKGIFDGVKTVFLLRPPHISDVSKVFAPLIKQMKHEGVLNVVFLSVQSAEKNSLIPHNKIEKILQASGMNYIFVRPGYFMQNLTTTLANDIKNHNTIFLPSANAKFLWTDADNIGEVCAIFLFQFDKYSNRAFEITGSELENFYTVSNLLTEILGRKIRFKSMNPVAFYFRKRREGVPASFALVMVMLHFLPRFESAPAISATYNQLTGKVPTTLRVFINRERSKLL